MTVGGAMVGTGRHERGPSSLSSARLHAVEVVFWLAPLAAFVLLPDHLVLGSQILVTALFALSLDLLLGYAGIVSLGHAAFFGVGAYTAGLLAVHGFREPLSGLVAGTALAAALGFVVSFPVVRGQDLARLMITLAVGLTLYEIANRAASITGGVDGLSGVSMGKLFGVFELGIDGGTGYLYSLAVLFAGFLLARRIVHSPFGLALRGLRERAERLPAVGVSVRRLEMSVFTLAAGLAGAAGALLAQTTQFVGIDVLGFPRSAEVLIMLVLGGTGRLYGGLVGVFVFLVARDVLSGLDPVYWQFWLGLLLVLLVLFTHGGIVGGVGLARARFGKRRS